MADPRRSRIALLGLVLAAIAPSFGCPASEPALDAGAAVAADAPAPTTNLRLLRPEELAAIDPQRTRAREGRKTRALIVAELQGLESLVAATPTSAPDRPKLLRRLADGCVELQEAALRDASSGDPSQARKAGSVYVAARQATMKWYRALRGDPACVAGCRQETSYLLGLEDWNAGDLDEARRLFLDVVQGGADKPSYVARVYFLFGMMFDAEGKVALAQQSFREAAKLGASAPEVAEVARARLTASGGGGGLDAAPPPYGEAAAPRPPAAPACVPGRQEACPCLGGGHGVQVCNAAGTGFDPCQCSGY